MKGMIRADSEGHHQMLDVMDPTFMDVEQFGIDPSGPLPEAHQQVIVPEVMCPLNEPARHQFLESLDNGSANSEDDYGVQAFCTAKNYLHEILEESSTSDSD